MSSCGAAPALLPMALPGLSPPRARAEDLQHSQPGNPVQARLEEVSPVGDAVPKTRAVTLTQRCPCLGTGL